ncbi:MAG: glutathione S-transferase family protein [Caulobacteraceae bacterium]
MAEDIILHHYDASPFSEKVRLLLGHHGMAWRSVIQPVIMPKPDLVALTGGYRRIPVLQIGADIFCDTQAILAELARRAGAAPFGAMDWAINLWADRLFFQASVPIIFGEIEAPRAFIEDREKLSGRPFDAAAMKAAGAPMRGQWRAQAGWIDRALAGRDFLGGAGPGLADIAAYMNVWFLFGAVPTIAAELMAGMERLGAWRSRMAGIGHGRRSEMTPAQALAAAEAAEPATAPRHDPSDPLGLAPGSPVRVMADDYGRDPIEGTLIAANPEEIVLRRKEAKLGALHVHFPRAGYLVIGA